MFDAHRLAIQVEEGAGHPHTVRLLSPYAFDIQPIGFSSPESAYRVAVERNAFQLRAQVVTPPLSVTLRAAVIAGAANVPSRVERLQTRLRALGWVPSVAIGDGQLELAATLVDAPDYSIDEQQDLGVKVALELSDFVLDQLIVTRDAGEVRPSVERPVGDESGASAPWLYDPNERDRATARHRALENWLIASLREDGLEPLDPASEPYFDVAWRLGSSLVVCEVKTTGANHAMQMRLGIGQVLHYRAQLLAGGWTSVIPALLVEKVPTEPVWMDLCNSLGIVLFDADRWIEARRKVEAATKMLEQ